MVMLSLYMLVFGAVLIVTGTVELLIPARMFAFWKAWVGNRFFFLHGAFLIALGLPLTCFSNAPMSTFVFGFGIILVFTGPFILLYANRIRKIFDATTADMDEASLRHLVFFDAGLRLVIGAAFVYSYLSR
jgi:hypothetical protein